MENFTVVSGELFPLSQVECSVRNGSSVIDLSPLIHRTGGYEAYDESEDDASETNPDFYINICQPLNPMHGVACPAGSAVCKVPVDGPPIVSVGDPRVETVSAGFISTTFTLYHLLFSRELVTQAERRGK